MYPATHNLPESRLVMLVDDAPDNLKMLSAALDRAGYMVIVATDGASALERLDYVQPDIILMDAVMPGMDGFETCRQLKRHQDASQVPVIFMTGLTDPEDVVRGFQAGGIDYVTKPVDVDVVLARLDAHLRTARMMSTAMRAVDAAAKAIVVLDDSARIVWRTAKARQWLSRYLDHDEGSDRLPLEMHNWARDVLQRKASEERVIAAHGSELHLSLAPSQQPREYTLLLQERAPSLDPRAALCETWQLTERECEVLMWLAKGKTNRDIGDILGISPRTVNKHLEHVYIKLGVETRAAAVALVSGLNKGG